MVIKFNKETSHIYEKENDLYWIEFFIRSVGHYIYDLIHARGYVYKNEIYERLDMDWDTKSNNEVLVWNKDTNQLAFNYHENKDGSFDIEFEMIDF